MQVIGYVTDCRKELVENTADIERGVRIMHKGDKFGTCIREKLLLVMKDRTWSADSIFRGQRQVRGGGPGAPTHTDDAPTS
ncbi:hypothetical protein HEP87_56170 [Streptomyces sp. S1D4-11]|nr:hypothetical protein [Streptomyces sp. S1D4-11]QIY92943.1 hypothetical protein HEP87_56170 [Streptomyces sp. S1D4-11]